MTDRELEQQVRTWYVAEVGETEPAPDDLRERVSAIPATTPTILRPRVRRRGFTLLAVAAVLVLGGVAAAGSGVMRRTPVVPPPPNVAVVGPTASLASDVPTPTTNVRPGIPPLSPGFAWTGLASTNLGGPLGETATLLVDGRVLLAGGCVTAAEVYDPTTGTFTSTGSMTVARGGSTATLLLDGRVLFTGGYKYNCGDANIEGGPWASAELYDPATGTFRPTGSMGVSRENHTATRLADGRVLIAPTSGRFESAELFDPATGRFSPTGSMTTIRGGGQTASLLQDGRVLVVGGDLLNQIATDLYDPATGRFSRTGPMSTPRHGHTATLLNDGRVLVVGGSSPEDLVYTSAELYDPATRKFGSAGSMQERRQGHTATLLTDGRVFIAGGYWSDGQNSQPLSSAEMYDPTTGNFSPIGSMGTPRQSHTATLLNDGRVLIAGGVDVSGVGVDSSVLYQP